MCPSSFAQICVYSNFFHILGSIPLWSISASVTSPHMRGATDAECHLTWELSYYYASLGLLGWNWIGFKTDMPLVGYPPCSCSNLMSRGGIQMGQTQIWQQRLPEANHVKVRTGCQVVSPPSIFPSFALSVALVVDRIASLFISPIKNTS